MVQGGSQWGGSKLSVFQDCPKKYFWSYKYKGSGLVQISNAYNASRGVIIHAGLQHFYTNIQEPDREKRCLNAIKWAVEQVLESTIEQEKQDLLKDEVIACLDQYFQHYATEDIRPIGVEQLIAIKVADYIHTGIKDLVHAEFKDYEVVVDHKTTTMDWGRFFKKWKDNLSLKGYWREVRSRGKKAHVMINGIRFKEDKKLTCEFERDVIFYPEGEEAEFDSTIETLRQWIESCEKTDFWPKNGNQCVVFGECEFRKLCQYNDPAMIKTFYKGRD